MAIVISQGTLLRPNPPRPMAIFDATWRRSAGRRACAPDRDLCLCQHDDLMVLVNVADDLGAPVDLSGLQEAVFTIAATVRAASAEITRTLSGGSIRLGTNAQVYFTLASADTGALAAGTHHHELRLTNAAGWDQTVLLGRCLVQDTFIGD